MTIPVRLGSEMGLSRHQCKRRAFWTHNDYRITLSGTVHPVGWGSLEITILPKSFLRTDALPSAFTSPLHGFLDRTLPTDLIVRVNRSVSTARTTAPRP